jgi:precorrin-2 dehydrogenase/sirohydrochlorin ferrochelatase
MFPIFLSLTGRRVLIVGGGPTGRRRLRAVLEAGGSARVVAREPPPADVTDPRVEWLAEPYRPDHLRDVALVLAAGPSAVNAAVLADARVQGIWAASASDPAAGDFVVPAVSRRGELTVAVGTGGAAPSLARRVCDEILTGLDGTVTRWIEILGELRPVVLDRVPDPATRRRLFERLTDEEWREQIRRDGPDVVRAAMRAEIDRAAAAGSPGPPPGGSV